MEDRHGRSEVVMSGWRSAVRSVAFGVGVFTLLGCGDSTGPGDLRGLSLTAPDQLHFTAQPIGGNRQITVPVKITNSTPRVINRAYCGESLERFHGAGWEAVWSPFCLAAVVDNPIPPGATATISITIADTPSQYPGFRFTDPEHQYRVRLELYAGGDDGTAAVGFRAATNAFEVLP